MNSASGENNVTPAVASSVAVSASSSSSASPTDGSTLVALRLRSPSESGPLDSLDFSASPMGTLPSFDLGGDTPFLKGNSVESSPTNLKDSMDDELLAAMEDAMHADSPVIRGGNRPRRAVSEAESVVEDPADQVENDVKDDQEEAEEATEAEEAIKTGDEEPSTAESKVDAEEHEASTQPTDASVASADSAADANADASTAPKEPQSSKPKGHEESNDSFVMVDSPPQSIDGQPLEVRSFQLRCMLHGVSVQCSAGK